MTGIGSEFPSMFSNPRWTQLHTRIVRYVVPFDTMVRPRWRAKASAFIAAAEAANEQVLVAFYHSAATPTRMPSESLYQQDVAKFIKHFSNVEKYQSWDEANRGNVPGLFSSPSAGAAAHYYRALLRICSKGRCTVTGLDLLDGVTIAPSLRYIEAFKHEVRTLHTTMPHIWGLHNYSDVNRHQGWRTRALVRVLGGQVWLTETGGVVQFGREFSNKHGSGLTRAAKALKFMFSLAGSIPKITRLYIYTWVGGNGTTRFDAGLMNAHEVPRPGYLVVCRQLHGANCAVRTTKT